ncbi:MAG: LysM peptidoglycan-binding domain-containing protein [Anaerolineaceae bacterium]|nr:LysM peptidoglycan-binding domain-containing protein [Anaerolineaceae bacterium]
MKKTKNTITTLIGLSLLCGLFLIGLVQVQARSLGQGETPAAISTPLSTLNSNLYSQTATPGLNGGTIHTVLPDQCLYHIVDLYGISLQDLLSQNNLTEDSPIFPGDQLLISKSADMELGQGTLTPELIVPVNTPLPSPTAELVLVRSQEIDPQPTPTVKSGFFRRVFSSNARFLALGVLGLVLFGVVLLIISSRRIQ